MRLLRTALLGTAALALALPALAQTQTQTAPAQTAPAQGARGPGARGPVAIFNQADTNKDGKVVWDEAWGYVQQRFNAADTNHDGGLSQEEMSAAWSSGRRARAPANAQASTERAARHDRMVGMMFRGLDANRDGRVTPEEIRPMAQARFRALDANGDGAVTRDELPQPHRHARRSHATPGTPATPASPAAPTEGSGTGTTR